MKSKQRRVLDQMGLLPIKQSKSLRQSVCAKSSSQPKNHKKPEQILEDKELIFIKDNMESRERLIPVLKEVAKLSNANEILLKLGGAEL